MVNILSLTLLFMDFSNTRKINCRTGPGTIEVWITGLDGTGLY